jgi:hypothetical protein
MLAQLSVTIPIMAALFAFLHSTEIAGDVVRPVRSLARTERKEQFSALAVYLGATTKV